MSHCLFESHDDLQVFYQYRALFNIFQYMMTRGEKFNKYSKIRIFQHRFLLIFFADICSLINH